MLFFIQTHITIIMAHQTSQNLDLSNFWPGQEIWEKMQYMLGE